jgi:hypothetical protein
MEAEDYLGDSRMGLTENLSSAMHGGWWKRGLLTKVLAIPQYGWRPASAPTIDCSPSSRRNDELNYAEWSGDDVGALDDGTATTTVPPGATRHSLPGGIVSPMPRSA